MRGYSFVFYEPDQTDPVLHQRPLVMSDDDTSVVVGTFRGPRALYRVCIEEDDVASQAVDSHQMALLSNCLDLQMSPDYHTLAGWLIAVFLSGVAVIFMYNQKEKIEILYFNRQFIAPLERSPTPSTDTGSTQNLQNSQTNLNNLSPSSNSPNGNMNKVS